MPPRPDAPPGTPSRGGYGLGWGMVNLPYGPGQQPHEQSNVIAGDVDQIALLYVRPATQPGPAQAAAIEDQGEAALHQFGAEPERLPRNPGEKPRSIVVDRPACRIIAVPAGELVALWLGNAILPRSTIECFQSVARVIPLVGDQLGGRLRRRRGAHPRHD